MRHRRHVVCRLCAVYIGLVHGGAGAAVMVLSSASGCSSGGGAASGPIGSAVVDRNSIKKLLRPHGLVSVPLVERPSHVGYSCAEVMHTQPGRLILFRFCLLCYLVWGDCRTK